MTKALKSFSMKLEAWNKDTLGNTFQRKKQNILRHECFQRSLERHLTEGLLKLELKLRLERKELFPHEELLWLHKSRNDCSNPGWEQEVFSHLNVD